MIKRIIFIIFFIICSDIKCQETKCFEGFSGSYWPLKNGLEKNYSSAKGIYKSTFGLDSLKIGNHYYKEETMQYKNGIEEKQFWREDKNGAIYYFDKEDAKESMELAPNFKVGTTWKGDDGNWSYKVVSLNSRFSTPYCLFTDLLEIKTENKKWKGTFYQLFYKKGVGMVGLNMDGKPSTYLLPNIKLNERSVTAIGCEKFLSSEEMASCTSKKISQFIISNFRTPKTFVKGKMNFKLLIDKEGNVEKVETISTLDNGELQEQEIIRILKILPKFIPAQVDDDQLVRSFLNVPINF